MAVTGKTGADAIAISLLHICRVLNKYQVKLTNLIATLEAEGILTSAQATVATSFIAAANAACAVFQIIANNSGF